MLLPHLKKIWLMCIEYVIFCHPQFFKCLLNSPSTLNFVFVAASKVGVMASVNNNC